MGRAVVKLLVMELYVEHLEERQTRVVLRVVEIAVALIKAMTTVLRHK